MAPKVQMHVEDYDGSEDSPELMHVADYDDELDAIWNDMDELSKQIPIKLYTRPWHFKNGSFMAHLDQIQSWDPADVFDLQACRRRYQLLKEEGMQLLRDLTEEEESGETLIMAPPEEEPASREPEPVPRARSSASVMDPEPQPEIKKRPSGKQEQPQEKKTKCLMVSDVSDV